MTGPSHNKVVVCYIGTWAVYRQGIGKYEIENFNPNLCTHVIYSFAGLNPTDDTIKSLDPWQDLTDNGGKGGYTRLTNFKRHYPHLKVSIAIGGWNEGSENYSRMVADSTRRKRFIDSVLQFLRKYNFDGLDVDWEYPGQRGGSSSDKSNFLLLIQELKAAFSRDKYLLTAAIGAGRHTIDTSYNMASLSKYLDFFHVMSYDYHGAWDGKTGANAPLPSVEESINYMVALGADPRKIVMGIPLYGRTFISKTTSGERKLGEDAETTGFPGPYTNENGLLGYYEVCLEISRGFTRYWDENSKTPFAVCAEKVVAYDDEKSISEKVKFAMQKNLIGCMVWSVDTDCFHDGYPLMKEINNALRRYAN